MKNKLYILFLVLWTALASYAQAPSPDDSTLIKKSWFVVPIMSYKQETSFGPGLAGGFYFKSANLKRISSISYSAIYTIKNQFTVNLSPKIYIDKEHRCYLYSNFGFRNYPNEYYGKASSLLNKPLKYTARNIYLNLEPQYELIDHFFLGFQLAMRYENMLIKETEQLYADSVQQLYGIAGWTSYFQTGLGVLAAYDTRDSHFYPTNGLFAKASVAYYPKYLSTFAFGEFLIDYRQYVTTWFEQVLAWQIHASGVWGNTIPFAMLPTLGGSNVLRGFREGKYADDFSFVGQVEYRVPLFWRLKATVFCAGGDVLNWKKPQIDKLKFAYGVGLRCRLNDARVHLRIDIAKNNYERKPQFYITATEAF